MEAMDADSNENIPILMMHGISGSFHDFDLMHDLFKKHRPGVLTIPLDVNNKKDSFGNLEKQVVDIQNKITELKSIHKFSKYHLICHSQGGLLCRALVSMWNDHNVQKLVLMSAPLYGQYGVPPAPFLPDALKNLSTKEAHVILYNDFIQSTNSVANMWRDPLQTDRYLRYNKFMTRLYNETGVPEDIAKSHQYKRNLLRVSQIHMITSSADKVIIPWQSGVLGFYEKGSPSKIVPMEQQSFFLKDTCGFRALKDAKRLTQKVVPGKEHVDWVRDADLIVREIINGFF